MTVENITLPTTKCSYASMQSKQSNVTSQQALKPTYTCPDLNYTSRVKGAQTSGESSVLLVAVNYCDNAALKKIRPDQNWTCIKDPLRLGLLVSNLEIQLLIRNQYFDEKEYSESPIKLKNSKYYIFRTSGSSTVPSQVFSMRRNTVQLQDSRLSSFMQTPQTVGEFISVQPVYSTFVEQNNYTATNSVA